MCRMFGTTGKSKLKRLDKTAQNIKGRSFIKIISIYEKMPKCLSISAFYSFYHKLLFYSHIFRTDNMSAVIF